MSPQRTTIKLLTIADRHIPYALEVSRKLRDKGIRVEMDDRAEKIGYKIREAQLEKSPYMLIIGDKEAELGQVSVRSRDIGEIGSVEVDKLIETLLLEIQERSLQSKFEKIEN